MSTEVKIPSVGESITSGLISVWHKKEGDAVSEGDALFTLETDKVSTEITAEKSGTLHIKAEEGEEVEIGQVVATIDESAAGSDPKAESKSDSKKEKRSEPKKETAAKEDKEDKSEKEGKPAAEKNKKSGATIDVKVPSVGESITSGLISVWHKKEGDAVSEGEALFTLETDKVSTEITAEKSGILHIKAEEGAEVEIGQIVATIEEGAAAPAAETESKEEKEPSQKTEKTEKTDTKKPANDEPKAPQKVANSEPESSLPPALKADKSSSSSRVTRKKMSPLRRKIAAQLVMAQQNAAILTTFNECDMSAIMSLRKKAQEDFQKLHGVKLGFMSFFIKGVVKALKEISSINGLMDGTDFVQNNFFDIGVAVGTEKGLIVPVIRDADQKSFAEIERDLVGYAKKAREGKITIDDLQGGGFTISNGGTYGSLLSAPILNPPQSGILGMHAIQQRPVARDGQVVIRPMMYLALSYDHRVVDGKGAVTFLVRLKECLEEPSRLLLDI